MQVSLNTHRALRCRASTRQLLAAPKRRGLIAVAMLALQVRPAHAEQGWRVDAGPGLVVTPQYPGSRAELTLPVPMVDIAYGRYLFLNTRHGLGAYAINREDLQVGASLWFRRGDHLPLPTLNNGDKA